MRQIILFDSPTPYIKYIMIQAVPTNKFSTFTTVYKNSSSNSFNNEIKSNELKVAENRMAKIEERLLAVESTTTKRNIY